MKEDLYTCLDTEVAILGTMITSVKAASYTLEKVLPDDFYRDSHRLIFTAMLQMTKQNKPIGLITLAEELKNSGNLSKVGGAAAVAVMCDSAFEPHIDNYIRILKEKSERRQLRSVLQRNLAALGEPNCETEEVFMTAQKELYQVIEKKSFRKYRMDYDVMLEYVDLVENRRTEKKGIGWGFKGMNSTIGLLLPGRVYFVGARPGMGKTAFALTVAHNVAATGAPVYFASMEMNWEQIADRQVSMTAEINGHALQHGLLRDEDWGKIATAINRISGLPIALDDERHTTSSLFLKVRQFKMDMLRKAEDYRENGNTSQAARIEQLSGLGLLIVDFLQQFQDSKKGLDKDDWMALISGAMVNMAKELNIPVLCLTQLNRENEKSNNKRPQLSHLRGGGSQEQDAWAVLLLHREDYYELDLSKHNGQVEVIVAKNRSGPVGTVRMEFKKEYTKLCEIERGY